MLKYEQGLLTHTESCALFDEIDRWCRRTAISYSRFAIAAGVEVNTRAAVRNRGRCLTFATAFKLRAAMENNPAGISKSESRKRRRELEQRALARVQAVAATMLAPTQSPVNRDPCPWCNVRGDIGCRHTRVLSAGPVGLRVAG